MAADDLALFGEGGLFVDIVGIVVEILHALRNDHALSILPRSCSDTVAGVDPSGTSGFSRTEIGMLICFGRTSSLGERLTVCICPGEAAKVCAIALAHASDKE